MSEPSEHFAENSTNHSAEHSGDREIGKPSLWRGLKVFIICMLILAVFIPVFGRIVPQLLFAPSPLVAPDAPPHIDSESPEAAIAPTAPIPPIAPAPPQPIAALSDSRLQATEEKLAKLEAEISELKAQQEKQEAQFIATTGKAQSNIAAMIALSQLKEAIYTGDSYYYDLKQLKNANGNNPEINAIIESLMPSSEQGIVTIASLSKQFEALAKQALASKNSGWLKNTSQKFITIRKVGQQEGLDDEAVLARAETILTGNNPELSKALAELEKLSPPAKEIFADWMLQANKLLETNKNLEKLQELFATSANSPTTNPLQPQTAPLP